MRLPSLPISNVGYRFHSSYCADGESPSLTMRSSLQAQKDLKVSGARLPSDTSSPSYFPISIVLVIAWSVVFFFYTFNVQPPVCSISLTNNRRVPSPTNFDHFLGALSVSYSVLSVKLLPVLSHVLFSCRPSLGRSPFPTRHREPGS